jgi:hypothetical protein
LADAVPDQTIQYQAIFARLCVEALLADEYLADQVWELWNAGVIADEVAAWAWGILAITPHQRGKY